MALIKGSVCPVHERICHTNGQLQNEIARIKINRDVGGASVAEAVAHGFLCSMNARERTSRAPDMDRKPVTQESAEFKMPGARCNCVRSS